MEILPIGQEDMAELTKALRRMDFFRGLSVGELDEILRYIKLYGCKKGATIFNKGDPGDSLYVIKSGRAEAFIKTSFFKSAKVLGYLNPGDIFGEMALVDGRRRSASVRTLEPTQVFQLLRSSFQMVRENNPSFQDKIQKVIEQRRLENRQEEE